MNIEMTIEEAKEIANKSLPGFTDMSPLAKNNIVMGIMTITLAMQEMGYRIIRPMKVVSNEQG